MRRACKRGEIAVKRILLVDTNVSAAPIYRYLQGTGAEVHVVGAFVPVHHQGFSLVLHVAECREYHGVFPGS